MSEELYDAVARGRRRFADVLDSLDDDQWRVETDCPGWTAYELAAHLLMPMLVSFPRFVLVSLRHRGDVDRTVDHVTRALASRHTRSELVALLREHADDRVSPPRVGPWGQLAETCLHLRDLARPLGLPVAASPAEWRMLLDYLVSPDVAPALVRPGRLDGLRLIATDADWVSGTGAEVRGTLVDLGAAVTGRDAELTGPGAARLGVG